MTGPSVLPTRRWPDRTRPGPLDGPLPDGFNDLDGEFVVEWQVAEEPGSPDASADPLPYDIFAP